VNVIFLGELRDGQRATPRACDEGPPSSFD
jgi:hypothetical protein